MSRFRAATLLLYVVVLSLIGFLYYKLWWPVRDEGHDPAAQPRLVTPRGDLAEDEKATIELFRKTSPSVVHVQSLTAQRDPFSFNVLRIPAGSGTGFVWDEKGRIVTNYHVVKTAREIHVTLADHSTWRAYQVRYDEHKDLAVLWTDAPRDRLRPLLVGQSATLQVGQKTFAIGNPFGLDHTLTTGIISALGREIGTESGEVLKDVIQTDAAINPGNSGGPLLDSAGRLIGVNTAIFSPSGSSAGIGFAIPIDEVNRVVPRLIRGEKAVRPGLGIQMAPNEVAARRGQDGVLVLNVIPDGPAQKAGLRSTTRDDAGRIEWGDVIVGIDEHPIRGSSDLLNLLEKNYQVGQEVTVHFIRDGKRQSLKLTLTAGPR